VSSDGVWSVQYARDFRLAYEATIFYEWATFERQVDSPLVRYIPLFSFELAYLRLFRTPSTRLSNVKIKALFYNTP
jgi:hypothetical protein